jgi:hypothetical protein
MFAWCSTANAMTRVPWGSASDSRFAESVVLRVKRIASSARVPRNREMASLAPSYAAVATWDFQPAPRWTLLYQRPASATALATSTRGGALAAKSRFV